MEKDTKEAGYKGSRGQALEQNKYTAAKKSRSSNKDTMEKQST